MQKVATANAVTTMDLSNVAVRKNGYAYIYFSNESESPVWFDNVQLSHKRGPILEETHYYPFGLTMAGISSKAMAFGEPGNKRKYNGKELNNKEFSDNSGLEVYDFGARNYDPQIGRWHTVDPKSEVSRRWSTYNYAYDNPLRFIDPDGMQAEDWIKYTDANGGQHEDYTPGALTQEQTDKLKAGGATDIQDVGQTDIVTRGDKDGVKGSYQLNADGTTTKLENGKPSTTTSDAANTEPAGASPNEMTAAVAGLGSDLLERGTANVEKVVADIARTANGAEETAQLGGALQKLGALGNVAKVTGVVAGVVSTGYSIAKVVNQAKQGGANNVLQHRDILDASIGAVGVGSTILAGVGIISNPVGWAIGIGVLSYSIGTLIYDTTH